MFAGPLVTVPLVTPHCVCSPPSYHALSYATLSLQVKNAIVVENLPVPLHICTQVKDFPTVGYAESEHSIRPVYDAVVSQFCNFLTTFPFIWGSIASHVCSFIQIP